MSGNGEPGHCGFLMPHPAHNWSLDGFWQNGECPGIADPAEIAALRQQVRDLTVVVSGDTEGGTE